MTGLILLKNSLIVMMSPYKDNQGYHSSFPSLMPKEIKHDNGRDKGCLHLSMMYVDS